MNVRKTAETRPANPGKATRIEVCGHRLETLDLPATRAGRPELLFLHEGLGSVSLWRDFPTRLAQASGCRTVVYSRHGHGRSSPFPAAHDVRFMHREALEVVPTLRAALELARPLLIGHSTGASMALIHAGHAQAEGWPLAGVVAMAPLCFVEDSNLESIRNMQDVFRTTDLPEKMARHHDDAAAVFWSWNNIWLDPAFYAWSIEADMAGICCPVLAVLGGKDEYSSMRQIEAIRRAAVHAASLRELALPDCGHAPHRDQPELILRALAQFVDECAP